jgi:hypothetical protein
MMKVFKARVTCTVCDKDYYPLIVEEAGVDVGPVVIEALCPFCRAQPKMIHWIVECTELTALWSIDRDSTVFLASHRWH